MFYYWLYKNVDFLLLSSRLLMHLLMIIDTIYHVNVCTHTHTQVCIHQEEAIIIIIIVSIFQVARSFIAFCFNHREEWIIIIFQRRRERRRRGEFQQWMVKRNTNKTLWTSILRQSIPGSMANCFFLTSNTFLAFFFSHSFSYWWLIFPKSNPKNAMRSNSLLSCPINVQLDALFFSLSFHQLERKVFLTRKKKRDYFISSYFYYYLFMFFLIFLFIFFFCALATNNGCRR